MYELPNRSDAFPVGKKKESSGMETTGKFTIEGENVFQGLTLIPGKTITRPRR